MILTQIVVASLLIMLAAGPVAAAEPMRAGAGPKVAAGMPVNINTADVKELMTLDGIGRAVAQRIVEYRGKNGPFGRPEDVRHVSGIGKGLWERNRERIVVK